MSFDPIANIMERDGVDEREAIRRYAIEAASPEHKVCDVRDCPGFGYPHPELPDRTAVDTLHSRFAAVQEDAVDEVERLARWILLHHPELKEFIMGMGTLFFVGTDGTHTDVEPYMQPLVDFVNEWDDSLHLTAHPMRFTATGEKVTKW